MTQQNSREIIATKLGISRMTLYNWLKNPGSIPYDKYKQLEALDLLKDDVIFETCEKCGGLGMVRMQSIQPVEPEEDK